MKNETTNSRNSTLNVFIDKVEDQKTKDYINTRVLPQMEYYSKKSRECKKSYMNWMKVSIIIGIAIPVAAIFADGGLFMKALIAFLGSSSAGISSYLSLQNYQKLWENHRIDREDTLSVLLEYLTNTGLFRDATNDDKNSLLVEKCETIFRDDTRRWKETFDITDETLKGNQ